jgi:hypothetical protein
MKCFLTLVVLFIAATVPSQATETRVALTLQKSLSVQQFTPISYTGSCGGWTRKADGSMLCCSRRSRPVCDNNNNCGCERHATCANNNTINCPM